MWAIMCLILVLGSNLAWAGDVWPPKGWRLPTDADYTKEWSEYRQWFPIPFHASADFNGDGLVDDVWILIGDGRDAFGLFVLLGRRNDSPRVIELFAYSECCAQRYALALVSPGRHLTVCGRRRECFGSTPNAVTLKNPGFEFITLGMAGGLYYWSPKINAFRSVPVAD